MKYVNSISGTDATLLAERRRALADVLRGLGIGQDADGAIAEAGGATFRVLDVVTSRLITILVEKRCPVCGEVLRAPALHVQRATGAFRISGEPRLDTAATTGAVSRWLSRPHGCRPSPPSAQERATGAN